MTPLIQLFIFGLIAASGNFLGGALITWSRAAAQERLKYLIALGAGFMLAAVVLEVIPESLAQWGERGGEAMIWVLAGYLLTQLIEHTLIPHFHFGEETHVEELKKHGAATAAVAALTMHTFFDGVTIASGLLSNFRLGLVLFIAVLLHKVPEGFTVASIMMTSGRNHQAALKASALIAAATLAGITCVALVRQAVVFALPLSGGVTLYVAASDLIPEVNRKGGTRTSLTVFLGVALFYLTYLLLHAALK